MSTILDALRKVAEDQHTHGADVRTRLLSFPPRLNPRARQRPGLVWIVSTGVAISGFVAGAGLMYWRSLTPVQKEQSAPTPLARSTSEDAAPTATRPSSPIPAAPSSAVLPKPSAPSAPVLPPPVAAMKERLTSTPNPTATLRSMLQPSVPVTKKEQRAVPSPAPTLPHESPSVPSVQPELAPGNIPATPSLSSLPPIVRDALNLAAQFQPPVAEVAPPVAEVTPFPDPALGTPPVSPPFPTQPPPVVGESTTVQADVSLSFLQWSPEADKRMAFLRVQGGPLTMAQEGDTVSGFTVTEISPEAVTLRSGDRTWVLQVR